MYFKENAISENAMWKKYDIPRVWFEMAGKDCEWDFYQRLPDTVDQIYVELQDSFYGSSDNNMLILTITINDKIVAFDYYHPDTDAQKVINSWIKWIYEYYKVVPREKPSERFTGDMEDALTEINYENDESPL